MVSLEEYLFMAMEEFVRVNGKMIGNTVNVGRHFPPGISFKERT